MLSAALTAVPAATAPGNLFFQQFKIVPGGGIGSSCFGASAAVSDDGMTALIGGYCDNGYKGAAWLFSRRPGTWTQQFKFSGDGSGGAMGLSVALSADGKTALVGAPASGGKGQTWVYTTSGGGVWVGTKLLSPNQIEVVGGDSFGRAVAISPDGTLALVGAPLKDGYKGVVFVFRRSGSSWITSARLKANGAYTHFGEKISMNARGALITATDANHSGVVLVFDNTLQGWRQTTTLPRPAGSTGFGSDIALAAYGTTALVGGLQNRTGAAWLFKRSGQTWAQDGPALSADNEIVNKIGPGVGNFGSTVALSADGSVALIGANGDDEFKGAAWLWLRAGALQKLTPYDEVGKGYVGYAVALARDGNLGLVGGTQDGSGKGAAWFFANRLAVSDITPTSGPTTGGTVVRINGSVFSEASAVRFGSIRAKSFTVKQDGWIDAVAPAGQVGSVYVTVTTSAGTSEPIFRARFTYTP